MSIMICERCEKRVDTDFDDIIEVNDGECLWCEACYDYEFNKSLIYWNSPEPEEAA